MGLHGAFGENSYYLPENEGKLMIFICGVKPHASNFLLLETVNTFFYSEVECFSGVLLPHVRVVRVF